MPQLYPLLWFKMFIFFVFVVFLFLSLFNCLLEISIEGKDLKKVKSFFMWK